MAEDNKFSRMLNRDKTRDSSSVSDRKAERLLKKEQKRIEKLQKSKNVLNNTFYGADASQTDLSQDIPLTQEPAEPILEAQPKEQGVSKVDLSELKKVQEEIKQEKGEQEPEIDTTYKLEKEPEEAIESSAESEETPPAESESVETKEEAPITAPEEEQKAEEVSAEAETNSQADAEPQVETPGEEVHTEVHYREKDEIDEKLKNNDKVSRIDNDEIAKIKRQIALEQGIISAEDIRKEEEAKKQLEAEKKKAIKKPEPKEEPSLDQEGEDILLQQDDDFYEKANSKTKRGRVAESDTSLPPDESLPDNITDEDIAKLLHEQDEEALNQEIEEELEEYKGMTEQEIAEAKARKRKFAELKERYNSKEENEVGDAGDYKKNLDFSVNTSIKRFRVTPPKKPFVISACVLLVLIIVAGLITYFVLNRPEPPIQLLEIQLSKDVTKQYIGTEVDLRGVKITKVYSNGSTEVVDANKNMIVDHSDNIDNNTLVIRSYSESTYVVLEVNSMQKTLTIQTREASFVSIDAKIYQPLSVNSTLLFENILLTAKADIIEGTTSTGEQETIYIDVKEAVLAGKLTLKINNTPLEVSDQGFLLASNMGEKIEFVYQVSANSTLSFFLDVNISNA